MHGSVLTIIPRQMPPVDGTGSNGVCLLGEAYGEQEAIKDTPFVGPAGFRLERMVQQLGACRDEFLLTNVCWERPPGNREPTEQEIEKWRPQWEAALCQSHIKVVVPLGNIPLSAVSGLTGIQNRRGYLLHSPKLNLWLLPAVHPSFILRGNANWTAAWLRDVGMALQIAREGPPVAPQRKMCLNPSPEGAREWVSAWQAAGGPPLAVDIETPDKGDDEEEAEIQRGEEIGTIYRIGCAYRHNGYTHVLSIPWGSAYLLGVSRVFANHGSTYVVWNRHFDVPRLRAHGFSLNICHDAQEMWHVLHTDLPKRLAFVAPFLVPGQSYWKDQNWTQPAYYNAIDAAVTIEAFEVLYGT